MSITIVGTQGETPRLPLDHLGKEFTVGAEEDFEVKSPQDVGPVLLLRVHKAPPALPLLLGPLAPDAWFCRSFQLTPPRGSPLRFPAYQWLEGAGSLVLREGAAKVSWADHHPKLQQQRREELQARQEMYRWKTYQPGWPHCLDMETVKDLDLNTKYSVVKSTNLYLRAQSAFAELKIKGLLDRKGSWRSLSEMEMVLNFQKTPATGDKSGSRRTSYEALVVVRRGWWPQQSSDSRDGVDRWTGPQDGESVGCDEKRKRGPQALPQQPEYVFEHWQEDAFFASQFLNGLNPVLIHRCRRLPENFPVTDAMVAPVLGPGTSLQAELERGSLFLVDHGILSGVRTNVINGRPQFSAAPMTLLYQCPGHGPLLPLAIQLSQTPGPNSPIFLPSGDKWDWLLAKTWVRNADFSVHEALTHLLQTHLLSEVFVLATLRQLPRCHPFFKSCWSRTHGTPCMSTRWPASCLSPLSGWWTGPQALASEASPS